MPRNDLAIVIATRNRPAILGNTLERLRGAGFGDVPLWVYDDGGDDPASVRRAVSQWPNARLVVGEKRMGQAGGRNVLLRQCGRTFAIMLDDDQYFLDPGPLDSYLAMPGASGPCAVVAFQSINVADGRKAIPREHAAGETASFMGGACLFHVPSVLAVGAYRDFFVYGWEEPELAMRLWLRGFHLHFDSNIIVEHNHRITPDARRDLREYDYLYGRNIVLTHTLNTTMAPGMLLGVLRAIRFANHPERHVGAAMLGMASGVRESFSRWADRTPVSWSRLLEWRRYEKRCAAAR